MEKEEDKGAEQLAAEMEGMNLEEDIPAVAGEEFNVEVMKGLLASNIKGFEAGKTDIQQYVLMYREWTKFFRHFGNALVIALKDITDKANAIDSNQKVFQ